MISKHIVCRLGISIAIMVMLIGIFYLIVTHLSEIGSLFIFNGITVIYAVSMILFIIPIFTLNWMWYEEESVTTHTIISSDFEAAWVILTILGGAVSIASSISYLITILTPNNAYNINYFHTYLPYLWLPGVILIANLVFVLIYYKIGKRACKMIYGEK